MRTGLLALALLTFLSACSGDSEYTPAYKPGEVPRATTTGTSASQQLDKKAATALMTQRCSRCHSIDVIRKTRRPALEWEAAVSNCKQKGALLNPLEEAALLDYIKRNYGP